MLASRTEREREKKDRGRGRGERERERACFRLQLDKHCQLALLANILPERKIQLSRPSSYSREPALPKARRIVVGGKKQPSGVRRVEKLRNHYLPTLKSSKLSPARKVSAVALIVCRLRVARWRNRIITKFFRTTVCGHESGVHQPTARQVRTDVPPQFSRVRQMDRFQAGMGCLSCSCNAKAGKSRTSSSGWMYRV